MQPSPSSTPCPEEALVLNAGQAPSLASQQRLAAIDIGSNSIRLLVAEVAQDGTYRILDDEKQTTRLAHGLAETGLLSEEALTQSLEALGRMKTIAEGYGVQRLEVIATSAVREAANQQRFLTLARQRLALDIEVISAAQEGDLSFSSVARHFDLKNKDVAVMDLGGGSAELVFAAKGVIEEIYSLPLGAVRVTESVIRSDPLSDRDYLRLKKHIRKWFDKIVGQPSFQPHLLIGAGGTFTALAHISMRQRGQVYGTVGGYELNRSEVRHLFEYLRSLPLAVRRNTPGLHADRADIILAGLVVIERMMKLLRVNRLQIHDQGVRDGLLLRMIGRIFNGKFPGGQDNGDPLAGVKQFAAACGFEQQHALHVMHLAGQLFEQLQGPLQLRPGERLLLEAAALLHEVGYLINYEKHHQHSYHLIMHGNLRGLSPKQRELVANVARYHRRSLPKLKHENFARLLPGERETVKRLSALLRLADGLDRTHMQRIKSVQCQWKSHQLLLTVFADQKPEVDLWGVQEKGKLFEKVFGVEIKFAWQPTASTASACALAVPC
jgi:exopolyphosphatase/guanosine-5'-triphosphate,3'-diphosphate pyrophosphatase